MQSTARASAVRSSPALSRQRTGAPRRSGSRGAVRCTAGFVGSPTNLILSGCTTLLLVAGRFGLMPTSVRRAGQENEGFLKLTDEVSEEPSGDPAGFKLSDAMACGAIGHILGVGIVLGLKNTGVISGP